MSTVLSRRLFSFLAIAIAGATITSLSVSSSDSVHAAQTNKRVDCSAGALTVASAQAVFGANLVVEATVGDLLVIENSSATATCVVGDPDGIISNEAAVATGGSLSLTLNQSGSITLAGDGGSDPAVSITIDLCSLAAGSGTESDPWQVASQADFQQVGEQSSSAGGSWCSRGGNYLQTANFTLDDPSNDARVYIEDHFSGVYDGDHYTITLAGASGGWADSTQGSTGLFGSLTGTLKKVRLAGSLFTNNADTAVGSLVSVMSGGTVSESSSTVNIRIVGDRTSSTAAAGGLVGEAPSGTIAYSRYVGTIQWSYSQAASKAPPIGGLLGLVQNGRVDVADSYARPTFIWDNGALFPSSGTFVGIFQIGGLIGNIDEPASDTDSEVFLFRNYATPVVGDEAVPDAGRTSFLGGLATIGSGGVSYRGNFFLPTNDFVLPNGQFPGGYADLGFPADVGLARDYLTDIITYQSKEDVNGDDIPSGLADLEEDDLSRWAIEQGSVTTFVSSRLFDQANPFSRVLFSEPVPSANYQTRGSVDTVAGYPGLGRVWEICANENDGYPVLVWEERTCESGPGGSSSNRDGGRSTTAASLGLTDAEYAAYLASGLTLEQFQAQRLAATGPSTGALALGWLAAALVGSGMLLLRYGRKERLLSAS